ncbi:MULTISPECIES: lysophospholipid acyltransferase family protein [unclassified Clostridioides]|uniref:lysophospholipid acyltransferase family protein n=1 Tax=unclassified Clostridioides TaxID=2635829 RepID=UPI001D121CED|nr:1-acyl-sn-glycerol-3-phosphate acyltransferase [Clostridioides sp. ZZV15-6388]MCC0643171.1 1-acyl-sn-glycerol-3-phosphate acyltransferase [Clostridioides sp. ZZV14-6150]MCC0665277.1 1-acyl-sn-glycerol-3-phosphate acyltransferase [Clostridioides sp. ZZV15-6597]MCC0719990.1 1-acyl-sn-glycerol-3-phosphate acyltransferase [Clostridioides sp. ZZV14-6105]MCC0723672.1 1-acyl-sn-glycerol-3-phosphate acyltransferase [Clostridioides sp. ZZV14-6104]MCC0728286.1 1-acyl-sn-glycerol-3-phosphate acyltrans
MNFYRFAINIFRCFSKVFFKYEVIGAENIPDRGNIVVASNHKSNLDPVFLAAAIENREIAAIAKQELFKVKPLGFILKKLHVMPINREKPDVSTIKTILRSIRDGYVLGIFPEGTRIKGDNFGKAKAGLSLFTIKSKSKVVPVSIISKYKLFSKVIVYFGEPISFEEHFKEKLSNDDHERMSQEVLEIIKQNYFKYSK